jgi:molybdopterin-guanine dinucleotide biosynthesis adapter protein
MVPIISVVGLVKSGKTTFIEALVRELSRRKYRVGTLKHTSHSFEMDSEGKDSYRLKQSGSIVGGVFTDDSIGIVRDLDDSQDLDRIIADVYSDMDLVIIEGYKLGKYPRIIVLKENDLESETKPYRDEEIIAVVGEGEADTGLNYYGKYEVKKIAELLELEFIKPYSIQEIDLYINNKPVLLNEFVQKTVKNIINAIIDSLKGIDKKIEEIDLRYKAGK